MLLTACLKSYSQYGHQIISTDSSDIEITRNSIYKISEETFKNRDSVFYSARYIQDSTQLSSQGWKRKNGDRMGKWIHFDIDSTWLSTIDYTTHTWKYNRKAFQHQDLKNAMKQKADSIIIAKLGIGFFRTNVLFNFYGHTYVGNFQSYASGTFWVQNFLGDWSTPVYDTPKGFVLNYSLVLKGNEQFNEILTIELDSLGNLVKDTSMTELKLIEQDVAVKRTMTISRNQAISICKRNPLLKPDTADYETKLRFGWQEKGKYPGELYYEVIQLTSEKKEVASSTQSTLTKYYNVWRINPWTSELFYKKPLKMITNWNNGAGVTGKYLELNE